MRVQLLACAVLAVGASRCLAAPVPAVPGTLNDYIATGSDGVLIGTTRFYDFQIFDFFNPGLTPILPGTVSIIPSLVGGNPTLQFLFNASAGPGDLLGLKLAFNVDNASLKGATVALVEPGAAGDGSSTAVADLTIGQAYDPATGGISGGLVDLIAFHMDGISDPVVSTTFAPVNQLGVGAEFVVDGGIDGSSQLRGVTLSFSVPERGSGFSLALVLGGLALVQRLSAVRSAKQS